MSVAMSATDLATLFDEGLADLDMISYKSFHIVPFFDETDTYGIQLDGHAGHVRTFNLDEFNGPLELVDELNRLDLIFQEHDRYGDDSDLVEWAGKYMTEDKQKVEDHPQLYMHIPEDAPRAEDVLDEADEA